MIQSRGGVFVNKNQTKSKQMVYQSKYPSKNRLGFVYDIKSVHLRNRPFLILYGYGRNI